jgi:hypothetical protein
LAVLILNRFPINVAKYKEWLEDYNSEIYLFTNERFSDQFVGFDIKKSYKKFQDNGLVDYDAIELYEQNPYDAIIALDETEIVRAARLRERFNLRGQNMKSALAFRDKVIMKDYVSSAGLKTPAYKKIESSVDLYDFEKTHGYPFIIKPVDGMASKSVSVIKNHQELKLYLEKGIPKDMMVETFIKGTMHNVDGIISDGKIAFISVGQYLDDALSFKKGSSYTLLPPNHSLFKRIKYFTEEIIKSLPTPNFTPFHCEIFHTENDELVFCEIASRVGGGRLDAAINEAYGIDLYRIWVRNECSLPIEIPSTVELKSLVGGVFIPSKNGKLLSRPSKIPFDWVVLYDPFGNEGETFNNPNSVIDSIAIVLVRGNTLKEVEQRIFIIRDWFEENVVWGLMEK